MSQPLRILMVDDSPDDVALLRHALRRGGYDVTDEVVETPQAMRAALERGAWDVITSDHAMPKFSAPAALALAKELRPEVPFIILSGEMDLNLAVSLMRGGAKDYIQKRELARLLPALERELREVALRRERQQVDAALLASDSRLREVLENSSEAAYKRNLQTNAYEYLSPVFKRIGGYTPAEMNSLPLEHVLTLIHPEDVEGPQRVIREAIAGKPGAVYQVEYRFKHKKGAYCWLRDTFTVMRAADGQAVALIGSVSDIGERKRMEAALYEEDHLLTQMVGFTEELLVGEPGPAMYQKILDNLVFLSKARFGVLTLCNDRTGKFTTVALAGMVDQLKKVSRILGYEIVGKEWEGFSADSELLQDQVISRFSSIRELTGALIPEIVTNTIAKLMNMGEVLIAKIQVNQKMIGDFTLIMPAGTPVENVSLIEIYCRQIDMFFTRIKAVETLRESEQKYRLVADYTFSWEAWRAPGGAYRYISPSCERISGHTAAEFMANQNLVLEITHPDDLPKVRAHYQAADSSAQEQYLELEFRILTPQQEVRWIGHSSTAVFAENGEWLGRRETNRDITQRKLATLALRESESRYRAVYDSSLDAILLTGSDGSVLAANPAACRMLERSEAEIIQIGRMGILDASDPRLAAALEERRRTGKFFGELTFLRKHNLPFPAEVSASLFQDQAGNTQSTIILRDITERKRSEAELEALLEIMQGLVATKNLHDILALIHRAIGKVIYAENFFVVFYNKETGLFEEVYSVDQYDPPAPPSRLENSITAYIYRTGQPQIMTQTRFNELEAQGELEMVGTNSASWLGAPLLTPDGTIGVMVVQDYATPERYSERDKNFLGHIAAQVALAIERTQMEEARRLSEAKFASAFRTSPDAFTINRLRDGLYLEINEGFTQLLGYTAADVLGKTSLELDIWADPRDRTSLIQGVQEHGAVFNLDTILRGKDGQIKSCLTSSRRIELNGEVCLLSTTRDITERKQAEEQIRQLNAELEQRVAERTAQLTAANRELEAYSYSVSHDLRAPLRTMEGFSTLLMEEYGEQLDEAGQHYIRRIQEGSRRIGQLIHDLLNLSRVTRTDLTRQTVDLAELAQQIAADLTAQAPQRAVQFDLPAHLPVEGDGNLLRIVLENLLNNAFKFTSGRTPARIAFGCEEKEGRPVYFVRDNGAGFDMTYAYKLFGPFQRLHTEKEFPGTGIGLATVQRIIHRHGGRIWAEGVVEQGATFYFTLGA